ncbi:50S ribosomal protein L1 [Gloeobacter violaceus]|uniref:Large ribosomal subunit protein uL1 n=1 Tax=Gloeobacter violaceus (strain ATCC 29082 / PCC 7421) TaxID=251221 RepID=RL1_GLOVI|nr:50S ribosomal protein L1 [Gloeobacter violaceus]Q7NK78.1 RecName: Full=Large ribosomal subunit protein uL1; AltName: Full=50S ribosomal protein L1 [Gloeobacter violaceus PCC 7421]BAC89541.1 50S ribosomal protein L1 [Gloeobacter violaceus PCC 7421]
MVQLSKRLKALREQVDRQTIYAPQKALELLKQTANAKFDETAETHIRLGINPKYADQQVRSTVVLPRGTGKAIRIAVLAKGEKVREAEKAGADIAGSEELIERIQGGFMEFDLMIATPDIMPQVARLGKLLGPRGLMPSPKGGTVTMDLVGAIREFKAGKLEFRADRTGIVHIPFGKVSFTPEALMDNLKSVQDAIDRAKPSGAKGRYWRTFHIKSTMGPSIEIDINALRDLKLEGAA